MSFSTISIKFKAKRATELPIFSKVSGKLGIFKKTFTVIPSACKKVEKPEEEENQKKKGGRGRGRGRGRGKGRRQRKLKGHEVLSPLDCPLEEGQEYIFSYKLPISRFYPRVHVLVEWNLVEGKRRNAKEILCVQMNTENFLCISSFSFHQIPFNKDMHPGIKPGDRQLVREDVFLAFF